MNLAQSKTLPVKNQIRKKSDLYDLGNKFKETRSMVYFDEIWKKIHPKIINRYQLYYDVDTINRYFSDSMLYVYNNIDRINTTNYSIYTYIYLKINHSLISYNKRSKKKLGIFEELDDKFTNCSYNEFFDDKIDYDKFSKEFWDSLELDNYLINVYDKYVNDMKLEDISIQNNLPLYKVKNDIYCFIKRAKHKIDSFLDLFINIALNKDIKLSKELHDKYMCNFVCLIINQEEILNNYYDFSVLTKKYGITRIDAMNLIKIGKSIYKNDKKYNQYHN